MNTMESTTESITESPAQHPAMDTAPRPEDTRLSDRIRELRTLRLFCWNLWYGGAEVDAGRAKQAEVLRDQPADIVFLQECLGDAAVELGRSAGMTVAQQDFDTAVMTAAPVRLLPTGTAPYATAALVQTRIGEVLAWSVHLGPWDYGPYRGAELPEKAEEVFGQHGERQRDEQAAKVLEETARLQAELGGSGPQLPVIVAGDFNVPSSLDWNGSHRPAARWPATQRFMDAGYTDAFRAVHPDPDAAPGRSWSQIEPLGKEPRDRIDFIYLLGLDVDSADHLGDAADSDDAPQDAGFTSYGGRCRHIPEQRGNAFPSDHLAVRATVRRAEP